MKPKPHNRTESLRPKESSDRGSVPVEPERPAPQCTEHEWVVFSTALQEVCLLVQCAECTALGIVPDPSRDEWAKAFYAPQRPYRWHDSSRVVVKYNSGF